MASRCTVCRGTEGEGTSNIIRRLLAQSADYLVKQLINFREKRRKSTINEVTLTNDGRVTFCLRVAPGNSSVS